MRGGNFNAPTTQELQLHTQTILNNALYKKQFEDQYLLQNSKPGYQTKFQSFKTNNYYENYQNLRFNRVSHLLHHPEFSSKLLNFCNFCFN